MLPLEGVKILDLSNYSPGAFCTMILADFGAEVIKIEPARAFPLEGMGYSPKGEEKRRKAAFFALNRNKKSIGINLRDKRGQEILQKLACDADILIEGNRPGVVRKLGADYETIRALNPRLIYCSLSGYGQDGPYSLLPGHDINYVSIAGILGMVGPAEGPLYVPPNVIADFAGASLYGAIAILLAYIARGKTGEGQYIDHAYLEGAIHLMTRYTHNYFFNGAMLKRGESWVLGSFPFYAAYETKDGKYISIGCLEPHFWENLCRFLGREEFIAESWTNKIEHAKPGEIHEKMFAWLNGVFISKTRDEWFETLAPLDIPVGKVYEFGEVFSDPHVCTRNMTIEVEDQRLGKVRQIAVMPKLSATPGSVRSLSPLHGEHTDEILLGAGFSAQEISRLKDEGVIG